MFMGLPDDVSRRQFMRELIKRINNPIKPVEISRADAPCKEVIKVGKEANLLDLPIPYSHATDGGRYLTILGIINQDPDTGWTNVGNYRWMVKDRRRGAALWVLGQQGPTIYYTKYDLRNQAMPFCIAVGSDPLFFHVSLMPVPAGVCEYDILGGLREKPLEVVRAETNNLLVPADAEIVIEGEVRPRERTDEGPFGEYSGYTQGRNISPIFRVNCITTRKNPLLPAHSEGMQWCEDCSTPGMEAFYMDNVRKFGLEMPEDWYVGPQGYSLSPAPFKAKSPTDVNRLAQIAFYSKQSIHNAALVIVTDPDIEAGDARDWMEASGLYHYPADIIKTNSDVYNSPLHFYSDIEDRGKAIDGGKRAWDATTQFKPWLFPHKKDTFEHAYPLEVRERVMKLWKKLGFDQAFERKDLEAI